MQSSNEIWPVYATSQNNFFLSKNAMKNVTLKLVPDPF